MSDGGRRRASLGVEVRKSSQKWGAQRSGVRSIAWLGLRGAIAVGTDARHSIVSMYYSRT
jgi:hypothetical protein